MPCIGYTTPDGVNIDLSEFNLLGDRDLERLFGLPGPVCRALGGGAAREPLPDTTAHVTELIGDVRPSVLKRRHGYYVPLREQLWATWGSGVHAFLAGHAKDGKAEETLEYTFKVSRITVVGTPDHILDGMVEDYKTTSAFTGKRLNDAALREGNHFSEQPDWWDQLKSYAGLVYLAQEKTIKSGRIWAFFRDWQRAQSFKYRTYPQEPVACYMAPPMPIPPQAAAFLENSAEFWQAAITTEDENLPECGDLWGTNDQGLPRRCDGYCPVSAFCSQFQRAASARRGP